MKVLLIAESANPDWVSVPLVGWSLAHALRSVTDVHLVTQVRNREAILKAAYVEGEDFNAINSEAIARPAYRLGEILRMGSGKGWTTLMALQTLTYPYFEHLIWRQFGRRIQAREFDIVHRITPLSPTTPSPIAAKIARAGVPFVIGPLNGGVPWPPAFDAERRREREWLSYVRGVYKALPGRRTTLASASAILTGSRHTQSEIPASEAHKVVYLPENGIDPSRFRKVSTQDISGPLRACFLGRLVPYKGPDMLVEAVADFLRQGRLFLDIIGDGPMRGELEEQVRKLGVGGAVTFHGMLDHRLVQDVATRSNLLTFPSIREFGGGVVLEAMAMGVVPVVVDYAGPGELVSEEVGYKIPIGDRARVIRGMRDVLERILADPAELPARAAAGRRLVEERYTWQAKAHQIRRVYEAILSGSPLPNPMQKV